jgi:hypothetical protein
LVYGPTTVTGNVDIYVSSNHVAGSSGIVLFDISGSEPAETLTVDSALVGSLNGLSCTDGNPPAGTSVGNVAVSATSAGDPHFHGFQGQAYTITGRPMGVYNIISDLRAQYNARFISYGRVHKFVDPLTNAQEQTLVTYFGDVAVKFFGADGEHRFRLGIFNKSFDLATPIAALDGNATAQFMQMWLDDQHVRLSLVANPLSGHFESAASADVGQPRTFTSCDGNCTVKVKDNLVSLSGVYLPFTFSFSIEYNRENEIFLNTKIDLNSKSAVRPARGLHGLLGQTYNPAYFIAGGSVDDDDAVHPPSLERAAAPADAVWHHAHKKHTTDTSKVDFDFLDSSFLQGHLWDYELNLKHEGEQTDPDEMQLDAIWSDEFKFNRYHA